MPPRSQNNAKKGLKWTQKAKNKAKKGLKWPQRAKK